MAAPRQQPLDGFDVHFMRMALGEAAEAAREGEVPLGCVIVRPAVLEPAHDGHPAVFDPDPSRALILGRGHNKTEALSDATAHAEMMAIAQASAACGCARLPGTRLYVTKEPCAMCAGAIVLARPDTVVWGVDDPRCGGQTVFGVMSHPGVNHRPRLVTGVERAAALRVLTGFFGVRRRGSARGAAE